MPEGVVGGLVGLAISLTGVITFLLIQRRRDRR
jgi:hypothetical protein